MNIAKRWLVLLVSLSQTLIAINLGMALQRWDDGRASSLTVIAIGFSAVGLALLLFAQAKEKLAAIKSGRIGSNP
jgi:hypothetical protein